MARPLRNDRQIIVAVVVPGRGEPGTHEHGPRQPCGRYPNLAMPDGRMAAPRLARGEESPGSTEVRCRVTPGGGDPRESATESTPPACPASTGRAARVKRCGKSAPRRRQRRRQGKPHREQDQVGAAGIPFAGMPGGPSRRRSGRSHEALGNGRPRGMAIPARDQLQGRDRTRLIRRLAYLNLGTIRELVSAHHNSGPACCDRDPEWRLHDVGAAGTKKFMVLLIKPIDAHNVP